MKDKKHLNSPWTELCYYKAVLQLRSPGPGTGRGSSNDDEE